MLIKRQFTLFILVACIFCLLAGCTININVGDPSEDTVNETDDKTIFDYTFNNGSTTYESRTTVYIADTTAATDTAISSSDLKVTKSLVETYSGILQSNKIQGKIREEYPGVEYTLSLQSMNETKIFTLIATSEDPEYLEEICNMAASLLCEELPQIIAGSSCKVVDPANPAQLVGTN